MTLAMQRLGEIALKSLGERNSGGVPSIWIPECIPPVLRSLLVGNRLPFANQVFSSLSTSPRPPTGGIPVVTS
jgi:hypothetical protein